MSPSACSSSEERLLVELENALGENDVRTARDLVVSLKSAHALHAPDLVDSLFLCCERGHEAAVKLLLEHGVPYDARLASDDSTPLIIASKHCHLPVVQVLLSAKADPEATMRHNIGPLLAACDRAAGLPVARLLLEAHASPNAERSSGGTPLCAAACALVGRHRRRAKPTP